MTETERLLSQAREIALRVQGSASDEVVLTVFARLCLEHDQNQTRGVEPTEQH